MRTSLATALLLLTAAGASADTVYQLIADPGLTNGYSYEGTVTTDGTIGNVAPGDPFPITDWSITFFTPSDGDGVSQQILTPANSELDVNISEPGTFITFTPTQIILPDFQFEPNGPTVDIAFFTPSIFNIAEALIFSGAQDGGGGGVRARDDSENNNSESFFFPTPGEFVIATRVVPEPGVATFLCAAAAATLLRGRSRR